MFALTLQGGTLMSTPPDVCKTPSPGGPVPIPYVNIAQCNMVTPDTAAQKVFIGGAPALTMKSKTSLSNGDEAGNAGGGVVSGKFIGACEFTKGSGKVTIENQAAVMQGSTTKHNDGNTTGMAAVAGQFKVSISS